MGIIFFCVMPLLFITPGVKIDAPYYVNHVLEGHVKPWANAKFGPGGYMFQQDWVPEIHHGLVGYQYAWSLEEGGLAGLFAGLEPARLLDLVHPRGKGVSEAPDLRSLRRALVAAWDEIINNFKKRLQACICANGGHFEHMLA